MECEIKICDSFSMRYSITIARSRTKYSSSNGFYFEIHYYLYSPALKKRIGTEWRTTYAPTKKEIKTSNGGKPQKRQPSKREITEAIAKLLMKNVGLELIQRKKTSTRTISVELDQDELAVYWLAYYAEFPANDKPRLTDFDRHKAFAQLVTEIGSYHLSQLCNIEEAKWKEACDILSAGLHTALGKAVDNSTSTTNEKMQIVRCALSHFFLKNDINGRHIIERLIQRSTPRKTIYSKIAENMRPQAIPLQRFRDLYAKLEADHSSESKALQLMLLLGLSAEEACALNQGDVWSLPNFYGAYCLCVSKEYCKSNNGFSLISNGDSFRNMPLPYPLDKLFLNTSKGDHKDAPLLVNKKGQRLIPAKLNDLLDKLLKSNPNTVVIESEGKKKTVDLAFLATSYQANCRAFWQHHCGLDDGEIQYLGGLTLKDTLSNNYLDYNNNNQQYRMLKQLEHGIALITRTAVPTKSIIGPLNKIKTELYGGINTRAGVTLVISKPVKLDLISWRGIHIEKGGKENE